MAAGVAAVAAATSAVGVGAPVAAAAASPPSPSVAPASAPAANLDAPDPDVVRVGSRYYAYTTGTTWGNHIGLLESSAPAGGWHTASGRDYGSSALGPVPSWQQVNTETSPGVFSVGGRWVMFYDAQPAGGGTYCLSVATAAGPAGPFEDTSTGPFECQPGLGGSVDPNPFVDASGQAWLYWKSNDGSSSQPASLWAARLAPSGTSLASAPVRVLTQDTADHPWETTIENPDMVLVGGVYYLFFSGGKWNSSSYAEGYAVCDGPAGPCRQPQPGPLLSSYGQAAGPGGASLFADPSGHWWMAYAAWNPSCTDYGCGGARRLFVAAVSFGDPSCSPPAVPDGYRMAASDGGVFDFGNLPFCGSAAGTAMSGRVTALATAPDAGGYWLASTGGQVAAFGDATFRGDPSATPLAAPVVGMAATRDGGGYWLVARDGGVFSYGDAPFAGSMGGRPLAQPIVGMAADPATGGYWLVARDGGVFSFRAPFWGSTGGIRLDAPVVGMAAAPGGGGYWLVAADGGVFSFGSARFHGSMGGTRLNAPIVGMTATADGGGYTLVAADGGVFTFGDAAYRGSAGSVRLAAPVVAAG